MTGAKRRFLESRIWNFNVVERDRWVERQASLIPAGSRVLDIGAGSCPYRAHFAHCEYKTQDLQPLSSSQLRGETGYGQIDYVSDATDIPVPAGSFDVVVSFEMLEHVPDPVAVIREVARVLRPGGKLLLTAPLGSGIHQEPYHFYGGYTPFWYEKVLTEAGFEAVTVEPNRGFFKHYGQESIRFAQMTAPWRVARSRLVAILLLPPWALATVWFAGICPLLCHVLDPLDRDHHFTIGYHVTAVKRSG